MTPQQPELRVGVDLVQLVLKRRRSPGSHVHLLPWCLPEGIDKLALHGVEDDTLHRVLILGHELMLLGSIYDLGALVLARECDCN